MFLEIDEENKRELLRFEVQEVSIGDDFLGCLFGSFFVPVGCGHFELTVNERWMKKDVVLFNCSDLALPYNMLLLGSMPLRY